MWPFNLKPKAPNPPRTSLRSQKLAEFKSALPVGRTFYYLSRRCIAADHLRATENAYPTHEIGISARYEDGNGVIRELRLPAPEVDALLAADRREGA